MARLLREKKTGKTPQGFKPEEACRLPRGKRAISLTRSSQYSNGNWQTRWNSYYSPVIPERSTPSTNHFCVKK